MLLRAISLADAVRASGHANPVESLRRAGFRAKVIAGWLQVWDAAPLTPGARHTPREKPAELYPKPSPAGGVAYRKSENAQRTADRQRERERAERCELTEWSVKQHNKRRLARSVIHAECGEE